MIDRGKIMVVKYDIVIIGGGFVGLVVVFVAV